MGIDAEDVIKADRGFAEASIEFQHLDVASPDDWNNMAGRIASDHGAVFGLLNSAEIVDSRDAPEV